MHPKHIILIAAIVLSFTIGYCVSSSEVQYVETVRTDTVYTDVVIDRASVPLPIPKIRTVTDTVYYTYTDTVRISETFRLPYLIKSFAPVKSFEVGALMQNTVITTERTRYIQPNGIYVGVSVAAMPGVSVSYLRGKWQIGYTYRPAIQGHEIGVAYRVIGR